MPKHHLTDNCTVADLTLDTYEVGGVIYNGICSEKDAVEGRGVTFDVVHEGQNSSTAVSALLKNHVLYYVICGQSSPSWTLGERFGDRHRLQISCNTNKAREGEAS